MRAKVDKDFIRTLENLREKYGSDFENLNGLSEEHLNGNEFLQMFTETTVVADVSVDSSSNVKQKDVVTMRSELSKAREKWIAYHKIFMTLHELFGLRVAKKWFEAEWTKALYMHDANTSTLIPYSYKGTETIVVKYKDKLLLTSFSDLYDIVQEKETLLSKEDKAYCKYTEDLFVWDTENQWTKVIRVIRKPKTSDFHWIKTANGMSEIVTSNHPVITTDGDVLAEDILENEHKLFTEAFTDFSGNIDTLYCTDLFDNLVFRGFPYKGEPLENKEGQVCRDVLLKGRKGTNPIQNRLDLDFDFGWMLGFILAEGHLNNELVHITQQNNPYLQHAIDICEKKNWGYSIYKHNKDCYSLVLQSQVLGKVFFEKFIIGNNAVEKHLNPEILQYNKEFLKGIIGGVLDGDGTCTQKQGRRIHIRMTSRTLINQLAFIVRMFGYTVREQSPCLYTRNTSYESKHLIYHMAFTPIEELESFDSIKIKEHCAETPREKDIQLNSNSRYEFGVGESFVLNNTVITDEDKYVYDISVETGHFMCNNILSHNCFAYDLQRTAEEGLFWLKDREPMKVEPAKHLETFVDFIKEFISFTSNRTSGACGLPNLIPYMFYFWNEDVKKKAYPRNQNPKQFAKANIQRLIYAMNQPYCRDGIQSAFVNTSIFDGFYFDALFGGATFPNGEFMMDYKDGIMKFQKWFLEEMKAIKDRGNMFTFPVNTISLLKKNGKFADEKFARWACEHNRKWMDSNFFIDDSVTSLSNCCRLKSNIADIGYFNSVGGTALKVGSIKVSTINLARISLETTTEKEYLALLEDRVKINLHALHAVREIIKKNVKKGLLPNFQKGLLDFEHLYNTVGVNGIYETMVKFGYTKKDEFGNTFYKDSAFEFGKKIFETIHRVCEEYAKDKDYKINVEEVPAETAAVKFIKADKLLFDGDTNQELPLYGNQWIPLGIQTTMQERIHICSAFDSYCDGGSICHLNLDAPIGSKKTAWELFDYVTNAGVKYFAFTGKISRCEDGHLFYGSVCPECGKPAVATFVRIVGFYVPLYTMSKERKEETDLRKWDNDKTVRKCIA